VTRFSAKIGHMRADRLVAMLLVLQARGRVTATELATELEVSVKTARRDLEALAIAGIPVYSQPGRNGGWQLIGGARTDLSGLTEAEAKTLFMVAGPASTATPEAKAALRKLVRALPETFRADAAAAANSMVLDPASWGTEVTTRPAFLDGLRRAVVAGVQVRLGYADRTRTETSRVVHPLGLVEKGSTWYLVADTENGLRTFRVNRVRSVELTMSGWCARRTSTSPRRGGRSSTPSSRSAPSSRRSCASTDAATTVCAAASARRLESSPRCPPMEAV
jgi:predicted DNA-binding transcriptional regulator YafY